MNGIHDMGGMHGMGPIQTQKDEPVFHAPWESRAYAVTRAMGAWGKWNLDAARFQRELIAPRDYLEMTYYERWIAALMQLMMDKGLVTPTEIETGKPEPGTPIHSPALTAEKVPTLISKGVPARRNTPAAAAFQVGDRVRARNVNPVGHTRLPRYARGKIGIVVQDHGVFVFPDTNAHFLGESPQHVYSVRFDARELWGEKANPRDSVYVDIWNSHLEPV
jgi:nitrile hydratase subunit beta